MEWFYAQNGQQLGPVTEGDLQQLVQSGVIKSDTLVWKEGMAEWKPYGTIQSTPSSDSNEKCAECSKEFPKQEMVQFKNSWVCATCKPLFFQRLQEGGDVKGTLNYAGFWPRAGAKIIDGILLMLVAGLPFLIFFFSQLSKGPLDKGFELIINLFQLAMIVVGVGYNTWFVGKYGATPGKMLLRLKVVMEDGDKLSYMRALGRHFAEMLSGMICYIGYIMVAFDEEKRSLHDRICNTRVVKS